jgi:hypothetical protein
MTDQRTTSLIKNLERLHAALTPSAPSGRGSPAGVTATARATPNPQRAVADFFSKEQQERGATSPLGGRVW